LWLKPEMKPEQRSGHGSHQLTSQLWSLPRCLQAAAPGTAETPLVLVNAGDIIATVTPVSENGNKVSILYSILTQRAFPSSL
jgi:hypothetical protein